jgi:hypothetical protein
MIDRSVLAIKVGIVILNVLLIARYLFFTQGASISPPDLTSLDVILISLVLFLWWVMPVIVFMAGFRQRLSALFIGIGLLAWNFYALQGIYSDTHSTVGVPLFLTPFQTTGVMLFVLLVDNFVTTLPKEKTSPQNDFDWKRTRT